MPKIIDNFHGDYSFLSNFHPCSVTHEGITYRSSEHAFQAAKTLNVDARKVFTLQDMTPGMAKHLGRALVLRPNWDLIKLITMADILKAKFSDFQLKKWLLETGDAQLIEGNTWNDTYWGVCRGEGKNFLGKLLMELRTKLANEQK